MLVREKSTGKKIRASVTQTSVTVVWHQ